MAGGGSNDVLKEEDIYGDTVNKALEEKVLGGIVMENRKPSVFNHRVRGREVIRARLMDR